MWLNVCRGCINSFEESNKIWMNMESDHDDDILTLFYFKLSAVKNVLKGIVQFSHGFIAHSIDFHARKILINLRKHFCRFW